MRGPSWPWTVNAIWFSFLREAPAQTITVGYDLAMTSGLIRWLRCAERPGSLSGVSNWCIMISGTMTLPHRLC